METIIIYQGQPVQVEKVNYVNGQFTAAILPDNWSFEHQGEEKLFRDVAGRYYLERTLHVWDVDGTGERPASGRMHVHLLSLKAALLWAIMRANALTNDLRHDLTGLLKARISSDHASDPLHGLDREAAGLVRYYLVETPYDYTAADIIGGCVRFALDQAFEDLPEAKKEGLDSDSFHDGAWGYVEQEVVYAQHARLNAGREPASLPGVDNDDWLAGLDEAKQNHATGVVPAGLDGEAFGLLAEYLRDNPGVDARDALNGAVCTMCVPNAYADREIEWAKERRLEQEAAADSPDRGSTNGRRRHHADSADVALLAASEPEPVTDEEVAAAQAARRSDPKPARNTLLDLAAEWRTEGQRTGGRIAIVLEKCAASLETTLG